jgi:hypothetical protein
VISPRNSSSHSSRLVQVIHSSWSHGPKKAKWRVLIPTDFLLDIEGYKLVTGYIINRLHEMGVWTKRRSARRLHFKTARATRERMGSMSPSSNPACLLFVPSQGAHPDTSSS